MTRARAFHPVAFLLLYGLLGLGANALFQLSDGRVFSLPVLFTGVLYAAAVYRRWIAHLAAGLFACMLAPVVLGLGLEPPSVVGFYFLASIALIGLVEVINGFAAQAERAHVQLRETLTHNPAIVYQLIPDPLRPDEFRLVHVSANLQTLLGVAPGAVVHTGGSVGLCGDLAEAQHTAWRDALWHSGEAAVEYAFARPDGNEVWVRDECRLVRDDAGRAIRVVGYVVNITRQHEMAARLFEQERQLAQIVSNGPVVLFRAVVDHTQVHGWRFELNSPNVKDVVGYSAEELAADAGLWISRIHPDDRQGIIAASRRVAESIGHSAPVTYEYRFTRKDGREIWLQDTLQTVQDDAGHPIELYGQSLDVTDRQLALAAAAESRRVHDESVRNGPAIIFRAVPLAERHNGWSYVYHSPNTVDLLGYSASEIEADPGLWLARVHPDDCDALVAVARDLLDATPSDTLPVVHDYRFRHKDGHYVWLQDNLRVAFDAAGHASVLYGQTVDVSPRKRAEHALDEQHRLLKQLTDALPSMTFIADLTAQQGQGEVIYANRFLPDYLGYQGLDESERLSTAFLWRVVHPQDRATLSSQIQNLATLPDGATATREYRVEAADGSWRWLRSHMVVFSRAASGRPKQVLGLMDDVTAIRHTQVELATSQRLFERVALTLPSALQVVDAAPGRDGQLIFTNRSLAAQLGYAPGTSESDWKAFFIKALHPDDRHAFNESRREWAKLPDGAVLETEFRLRDAFGRWHWFTGRHVVFERDGVGQVSKVIGLLEDVTVTRILQDEIRNERDFAQRVLSTLGQGVLVLDGEGRCEYINPAGAHILGVTPDAVGGHEVAAVLGPGLSLAPGQTGLLAGAAQTVELTTTRRDGQCRDLLVTRTTRARSDDASGTVIVFTDMTDRKVMERALSSANRELAQALTHARELTSEAQAATRAKSDFLANMSHEIRTPMNAILGMAELLQDTPLSIEQNARVQVMIDSGQALLAIINDILDFSKIEAGRLELDRHVFNLTAVVESAVDMLAPRADAKGLALQCLIDPAIPAGLYGDSGRVRQILLNLLSNAIKFTNQGAVTLRVELEPSTDGRAHIRLAVRDTGIGITPEAQVRLFNPFEQAESSTTRRYGGTGLGLAIVRRLVDLMGGEIGLESRPEVGTTVTLTLTFTPVAGEPQDVRHSGRVWLIEPDVFAREVVERYLIAAGLTCKVLPDADGALIHERMDPREDVLVLGLSAADADLRRLKQVRRDPLLSVLRRVLITTTPAVATATERVVARPIKFAELVSACAPEPGSRADVAETRATPTDGDVTVEARRRFILLAEDNPINQRVASLQLAKLGFEVETANDGTEAVAVYRADPDRYQAIFMDCQMPILDGFAASSRIRAWETEVGRHIPVIAMTANAMAGDRELCLAAGMDDYLSKPVSRQALHDVLVRNRLLEAS